MRQKTKTCSPYRKLFVFAVALAALLGGYFWGNQQLPLNDSLRNIHLLEQPKAISDFQLPDLLGSPFTPANFTEYWKMLFIGHTQDKETTPAQLTLATRIINRLADKPRLQQKTKIISITVYPEHDTPETLKPFIGRYSADFQVLTGDDQQIRNIAHQLGIKYQRDEKKEGGYSIVHSSSIALINHQSELQGLFTGRVDASSIT